MAFQACLVKPVKVIRAQISLGAFVAQDMLRNHQDAVGDGACRPIHPAAPCDPMVLGRALVAAGARTGPRNFAEHRFELAASVRRRATQPLPSTLFVAWTEHGP